MVVIADYSAFPWAIVLFCLQSLVFGLSSGLFKIAFSAFVRLRRLSVALLQNLPKSRAKSGRARLAFAPRAFFQIFIKATLNRRFAGLVRGTFNAKWVTVSVAVTNVGLRVLSLGLLHCQSLPHASTPRAFTYQS